MHTSLDQALGRNPRLNRVGQSLLNIASGASAAYSLRSLTGGDPNVVRVRRESDNAERDFTASEVSSSELTTWVNSQTTLPLDLRTLQADGRTGAIIDAKAAYSLRNLSSSYTGNVVEVRRSSDDTERNFTASEVSDGTLASFCGQQDITSSLIVPTGIADTYVVSDVIDTSNYTITANNPLSAPFREIRSIPINTGQYRLTGTATITNCTSGFFRLRSNGGDLSTAQTSELTNGVHQIDLTVNVGGVGNLHWNSAVGTVGTLVVTNLTWELIQADGHVKTWYDQSSTTGTANNNHATQSDADKQPKIVNAGTYLGEIDFDGTDDYLDLTSAIGATTESAVFTVAESGGGNDKMILDNRDSAVDGYRVFRLGNAFEHRWSSAIVDTGTNPGTDTKFIGFANHSGSAATAGVNGAAVTSVSDSSTLNVTNAPRIGARSFSTPTTFWDGTMNELIIYTTDQTDNRTALEANIGEHYSISGIPAYDNTVNGFVETWYDQSGNGNDATQTSADAQPKIVNSGNLVAGGIDFDGTDSYLVGPDISLGVGSRSAFIVTRPDVVNTSGIVNLTGVQTTGSSYAITPEIGVRCVGPTWLSSTPASTLDDNLVTSVYTSGNLHAGNSMYLNGASVLRTGGTDGALTSSAGNLIVGSTYTNQFRYDGTISEFIIYDSDQSSKRELLEANIAAANGITLS